MTTHTNKRIAKVEGSATLAMKTKALELKAKGVRVIDLTTGEPEVSPPEYVFEAVNRAMRNDKNKYTAVAGIDELRAALATKLSTVNAIPTTAADVIVTNGGKQGIYAAFDVALEPGDEVVIPAPYWVSYPPMVTLCGAVPVVVSTREQHGYRLTPEQLAAALTPRTKIVALNSPCNPTGTTYTVAELRALGAVLKSHHCLVLSDDVYEKICFTEFASFATACPELRDRTITVNAFSKSYAMTGWRVGYVTGPRDVIAAMSRHQSQTTSNVCSIAQWGALAALQGGEQFTDSLRERYRARMRRFAPLVAALPGISMRYTAEGAYYLFPRTEPLLQALRRSNAKATSEDLVVTILERSGVALVGGRAFGDDGAVRLSLTSNDADLEEAIQRLKKGLEGILEGV